MRSKSVVAGLALTAAFGASARANLLTDANFESPVATNNVDQQITGAGAPVTGAPIPWYDLINYTGAGKTGDTAFISSDIPQYSASPASDRINSGKTAGSASASTGGNAAQSGDQYAYAFTVGQTSGTKGGIGQLVATGITPGDSYVGTAYFFDKDNGGAGADGDRLNGNPSSADTVQLVWEDGTGAAISTSVSTASLAGTATVGTQENQWVQLTTGTVTAPANAAQVLFELVDTRGSAGGVMFADNADLEDTTGQAVPEPASLGLALGGGLMVLRRRRR